MERALERSDCQRPIPMARGRFVDAFQRAGWPPVAPFTYIVDAKGRLTHFLRGTRLSKHCAPQPNDAREMVDLQGCFACAVSYRA